MTLSVLTESILPTAAATLTPITVGQGLLALPFDALRAQYAGAVRAGLAPRSIVESGKWERGLDALEKLLLGPLARQR
jgi:Na+/H+-translocating membrane pyrophosphatase